MWWLGKAAEYNFPIWFCECVLVFLRRIPSINHACYHITRYVVASILLFLTTVWILPHQWILSSLKSQLRKTVRKIEIFSMILRTCAYLCRLIRIQNSPAYQKSSKKLSSSLIPLRESLMPYEKSFLNHFNVRNEIEMVEQQVPILQ